MPTNTTTEDSRKSKANPAFLRDSGKPGRDCPRCPRLVAFREEWRKREPGWFNAPVASLGPKSAGLLIVGLAPGLQGANRTGRPFTGDYAGDLLFPTLMEFGFACGRFESRVDDSLELTDARLTNAVRCVPPENKPTPAEIATCRTFLEATIAEMKELRAIVALGRIAHEAVVVALGQKKSAVKFGHGLRADIGRLALFDSYHCSRYNTNTGVLTPQMFRAVFAAVRALLDEAERRRA
jgi:uracil-DNA glycosylase family 4